MFAIHIRLAFFVIPLVFLPQHVSIYIHAAMLGQKVLSLPYEARSRKTKPNTNNIETSECIVD